MVERDRSATDWKFYLSEQWDEAVRQERQRDGRPCLTINMLPQFVNQVSNEARQQRAAIVVKPEGEADEELAEVLQGLIRQIEVKSRAALAYDGATQDAIIGGVGYFRIDTKYCAPGTFDQDPVISYVQNPFAVYIDPDSIEQTGEDAKYAFIDTVMTKKAFQKRFGKDAEPWRDSIDRFGWNPGVDMVRIGEYFWVEEREYTIAMLESGETTLKSAIPREMYSQIRMERAEKLRQVRWILTNGYEVFDSTDVIGERIPIFRVVGNQKVIDGQQYRWGLVRNAIDPQRQFNFWESAATEMIGNAPKSPFLAPMRAIQGLGRFWETLNTKNHAVLPYNDVDEMGTPVARPERSAVEAPVVAIMQAKAASQAALNAVTGIYPAAIGARSNETSGVAINARARESDTSTYHYADNRNIAITAAGKHLLNMISVLYTEPRVARILGKDGAERSVKLNQQFSEGGVQKVFDVRKAKEYNVVVEVGPSFQTRREQAVANMLEVSKIMPQVPQIAPDLIVNMMDFPEKDALVKRLKGTLPPQFQDDNPMAQLPPQVQGQIQQQSAMIEALTEKVNEQAEVINAKRIEAESRERIEFEKIQAQREELLVRERIELAKLGNADVLMGLRADMDWIKQQVLAAEVPQERESERVTSENETPEGENVGV